MGVREGKDKQEKPANESEEIKIISEEKKLDRMGGEGRASKSRFLRSQ